MPICGIEMSGSEAMLVLLSGTKVSFSHVDVAPKKLKLTDDENPVEVKAFRNSLFAFFREHQVAHVAIKKRGKKGDYSGVPIPLIPPPDSEGSRHPVPIQSARGFRLIPPPLVGA